jgi:hypothetical protein
VASARSSRRHPSWTRTTAVAVAALALGGCSATNPITTSVAYNVVDGVPAELGSGISANSLLVFAAEEGAPGSMSGALSNESREDVEVTIAPEGADEVTVTVPARGTVLLGADQDEEIELESVEAPPGAALSITLSTPEGGSTTVPVPVFDATLPEYEDQVPEAG